MVLATDMPQELSIACPLKLTAVAWHNQVRRPQSVLQASAPALPEASPDAVQQLVAMGFDAATAAAALQQSHNDIQTALTLLL